MKSLDRLVEKRGDQELITIDKPQIEQNPRLDAIVTAHKNWLDTPWEDTFEGIFNSAVDSIRHLDYTASDVIDFCFRLSNFEDHKFFSWNGLYLSALVYHGKDDQYELVTEHLGSRLDRLGYRNCKDVTIVGSTGKKTGNFMDSGSLIITMDCGLDLGKRMDGGSVIVYGKAGNNVGIEMSRGTITIKENSGSYTGLNMSGGDIIVEGNVGAYAAFNLAGGIITVGGNAGKDVGLSMTGGLILVGGDIKSASYNRRGGEIWERGELIKGGRK